MPKPKKKFLLDTNVLLHDPEAYLHFKQNLVIIPLKVIEEIDQFKRELTERGRNARTVARMLDELRAHGRLNEGIKLEGGGVLRVEIPRPEDVKSARSVADDVLIEMAERLHKENGTNCILVTKDINLRLKADARGIKAEDYENGRIRNPDFFEGHRTLDVPADWLIRYSREGSIEPEGVELCANEYVMLRSLDDNKHTLLGRFDLAKKRIVGLQPLPEALRSVYPRNREQHFAFDALLNDSVKLVTLTGKAGSGKTLLAVAAGVFKTLENGTYSKMLVSRPVFPMGKDLGFLPGTVEEKLDPWMTPIRDALELLQQSRPESHAHKYRMDGNPHIEVEPLTYIRGRSIPNHYMIVDETQNLTPLEVKTVITRAGHGTKIILTGDMEQIDNPYVDQLSNGLNAVIQAFRNEPIAAHVSLLHGVRSEVAELASNLL